MQHKNSSLQKNCGLNLNFTGSGAERNNGKQDTVGRRKARDGERLDEERHCEKKRKESLKVQRLHAGILSLDVFPQTVMNKAMFQRKDECQHKCK